MHIIMNLQMAARKGRKAFHKYLEEDCNATCELVKVNIFSPIGQEQLKKIQETIIRNKAKKIKHYFNVPEKSVGLEHTCSNCGNWVHPQATACTQCKKQFTN